MFNWIGCYLAGRHDYGICCEPGTIFLKCVHCGRRSSGWILDEQREAAERARSERAARAKNDARHPASEHAR
ncbi:MAG: hypothetical protein AB7F99_06455 [Vicinamibacterales bacterium]